VFPFSLNPGPSTTIYFLPVKRAVLPYQSGRSVLILALLFPGLQPLPGGAVLLPQIEDQAGEYRFHADGTPLSGVQDWLQRAPRRRDGKENQ